MRRERPGEAWGKERIWKGICSQHLRWILSHNSCLPRKEGLLIALSLSPGEARPLGKEQSPVSNPGLSASRAQAPPALSAQPMSLVLCALVCVFITLLLSVLLLASCQSPLCGHLRASSRTPTSQGHFVSLSHHRHPFMRKLTQGQAFCQGLYMHDLVEALQPQG